MAHAAQLAALMPGGVSTIQQSQTAFRCRLVDHWKIEDGWRVLEIGCGQGDTTLVLADAVGSAGSVVAIDHAKPTYGAPITLGDSARHISAGPLGDRIDFRFNFDVLDPRNAFGPDSFDAIVLAHCTWYFESLGRIADVLRWIRPWAHRLCLSEWDLQPRSLEQFGHFLAVLVQGQIEAFKPQSEANVRTPYSRESLRSLLEATGWGVATESLVDSADLDDGAWEIAAARAADLSVLDSAPPKLRAFVESQLDVLSRLPGNRSLPAYSIVAART